MIKDATQWFTKKLYVYYFYIDHDYAFKIKQDKI